jgi:uncharacterized repeat protein (TIGR02543 family)
MMASWEVSLSEEERWQVLTYIWSLGDEAPATTTTTTTLTIAIDGSGSATPAVGEYEYAEGEAVTISAIAANGWQFDGWTGDVTNPSSATTTVTMDASKTVTANFSEVSIDEEASLNIWLIIGAVLGVLVVGGVGYYFARRRR